MDTDAAHMGDGELLEPFDFKASQSSFSPKQENHLEANERANGTSLLSNPGERSRGSWQVVAQVNGKRRNWPIDLLCSPATGPSWQRGDLTT